MGLLNFAVVACKVVGSVASIVSALSDQIFCRSQNNPRLYSTVLLSVALSSVDNEVKNHMDNKLIEVFDVSKTFDIDVY